jgi:hypothetical protein
MKLDTADLLGGSDRGFDATERLGDKECEGREGVGEGRERCEEGWRGTHRRGGLMATDTRSICCNKLITALSSCQIMANLVSRIPPSSARHFWHGDCAAAFVEFGVGLLDPRTCEYLVGISWVGLCYEDISGVFGAISSRDLPGAVLQVLTVRTWFPRWIFMCICCKYCRLAR